MNDPVFDAVRQWHAKGRSFALVTVVGVRGSTYRGLAARQLVAADGATMGTVSGGCLDADLHQLALQVIAEARAEIARFDLTADDEHVWGWGIGCNGVTEVLVESAESAVELVTAIEDIAAGGKPGVLVHELGDTVRRHAMVGDDQGDIPGELRAALAVATESGRHTSLAVDGRSYLVESVGGASRLVVCGAGHDAVPVVRYGSELGFDVSVVDDRRTFLDATRFPEAGALVHTTPGEVGSVIDLDARTFVVIMSHNYLRDLDYLGAVMGTGVAYIGCLGPGERLHRLLEDLAHRGVAATDDDLGRIHGPAGLDIGAEGPDQIAWSIMAEVLAVRAGHTGGYLRDRKGPDTVSSPRRASGG